ncbi:hypothetical protein BDR06DRAFT_1015540 [Suillus hirtellus]|nr:hypothetical protein BDR06DRAFT_1015540 [Suillus hirtellus]
MNPSCHFFEWSQNDARQLLKAKGTIQDIDGECSLKLSGHSRKSCLIAPHYRLPLYALNKRFGLYRKVVEHLHDTSIVEAAHLRNTYLSVMKYLHDIRISFLEDAAGSPDPLHGEFRSPAMDYYLWLDHTADGLDDECRQALEKAHGVTFEGLKNGQCPDILVFLDWKAYHKEKCKEHDFCGALQGCGGGEDIQCLLNAVDDSVNALEGPIVTPAVIHSPAPEHSSTQMASVADSINLSNPFPPFPLPFGIDCCTMSLSTLGDDAREILIGGFGKWLPSHVAMRFREIQGLNHDEPLENLVSNGLLLTAQNTDEFLEIFGMAEMMATCQELLVDRGAMARFFTVAGHALYTSCKGKDCVVEYGQTLGIRKQIADAVRRDIDTHPATRIMVAVGIQYENIVEIPSLPRSHAMPDHGGPTDICPQDHLTISNSSDIEQVTMNDPSNIYDSRSSAPAHIMCDNPNLPHTEESPHEDYMVCPSVTYRAICQ